jgi:CCR4-NOT complex subunit CAF16
LVVEKWLRDDYKIANEIRKKKADGTIPTRWEVLSENMKEYGDKYFNYWN